jgi:hypothetical protein
MGDGSAQQRPSGYREYSGNINAHGSGHVFQGDNNIGVMNDNRTINISKILCWLDPSLVHADSVLPVGTLSNARAIRQICYGSSDAFSSLEDSVYELIRSLEQASDLCPNDCMQEYEGEGVGEAIRECNATLEKFRMVRNSLQEQQRPYFQSPLILQEIETIRMRLDSNVRSLCHQTSVDLKLVIRSF